MKIKLAVLDNDLNYLNRFSIAFGTKYADKIEIHSFTDMELAIAEITKSKFDLLIASEMYEVDTDKLPRHCGFAYFTESADIDTLRGQTAIGKFQRADLLYKQILSVYSENAEGVSGLRLDGNQAAVILFTSPSGGAGTSSLAAACAMRYAAQGKKVLYLNMEVFGSSDVYFSGEGQFDMSDIIFALKSKKSNLVFKLESCVKQSPENVYFYSAPKMALDMQELSSEETVRFLTELQSSGSYTHIVVDMDFGITRDTLEKYRRAHSIVLVGDGSVNSNSKIERAYASLATVEQNSDAPLTSRLALIYNKCSNKTSTSVSGTDIRVLGVSPRLEQISGKDVVTRLSKLDFLDKIL